MEYDQPEDGNGWGTNRESDIKQIIANKKLSYTEVRVQTSWIQTSSQESRRIVVLIFAIPRNRLENVVEQV